MQRYFDTNVQREVVAAIHDIHAPGVVELHADNPAFKPLPLGMRLVYDVSGIPVGTAPIQEMKLTHEQIDTMRKAAYQQRSDPLYMQWQYDQTPEAEQRWRAEVAAIKQEYPWPV